jgi:HSP20 family molecular chaperone IbpA
MFGDLLDWVDTELRMFPTIRATALGQGLLVEDYVEDGHYVMRAEIPGVDPAKDIDVTVQDGVLTVNAERREEHRDTGRSEFRYGAFTRSVVLPPEADLDDVTATYADGVLMIRVGLTGEQPPEPRRVTVTTPEGAVPAAEGEPPAAT